MTPESCWWRFLRDSTGPATSRTTCRHSDARPEVLRRAPVQRQAANDDERSDTLSCLTGRSECVSDLRIISPGAGARRNPWQAHWPRLNSFRWNPWSHRRHMGSPVECWHAPQRAASRSSPSCRRGTVGTYGALRCARVDPIWIAPAHDRRRGGSHGIADDRPDAGECASRRLRRGGVANDAHHAARSGSFVTRRAYRRLEATSLVRVR